MFATNPVLLKDLLDDVSSGKIQLPDFQRGWVWDDERIIGLLASISRGFPVGAIMTLAAGGDIKFMHRPIEGVSGIDKSPETFLLDGQQRLTSLYQSLLHPGPVDTVDSRKRRFKRWYYVDMLKAVDPTADREDVFISVPEDRRILKNFGREVDRDLSSTEYEYKHHMMPTECLLDSMDWLFGYNDYWQSSGTQHPGGNIADFRNKFRKQIIDQFSAYPLPVIQLEKETPKEAVCIVFEKVNTGGVTLGVFELVTATFAADNFSLRDDWAGRRSRLHEAYGVLQGINGDHFLQIVTLLATQDKRKQFVSAGGAENQAPGISCKRDSILNLKLEEYKHWADHVQAGLMEAAKFLTRQFIFKNRDIPYSTQIVPLAALFVELGDELKPAKAQEKLERWFWSGVFGESYGSNTEGQFALDLPQVAEYVRGGSDPTSVTQANFIPERLITLRTRNSAAYKGLYAFQMKSGAADWRTGEPLTFATLDSARIDIHHIFPKAWCKSKSQKIPPSLYDSIINKTPIDAATNWKFGGRAPSRYLRLLEQDQDIDSGQLDQILAAHWLRPDLLRADKFAECFIERGMKMLDLIGGAMGRQIHGGREVFRNALSSSGLALEEQFDHTPTGAVPSISTAGLALEEQFDDADTEHDEVGDQVYQEASA